MDPRSTKLEVLKAISELMQKLMLDKPSQGDSPSPDEKPSMLIEMGGDSEDKSEAPEMPGEAPDMEDKSEPHEDAGGSGMSPEEQQKLHELYSKLR